jgi:hypothetical protein
MIPIIAPRQPTRPVVPASLRLACSWQLRNLYVVPVARRCGAGRHW